MKVCYGISCKLAEMLSKRIAVALFQNPKWGDTTTKTIEISQSTLRAMQDELYYRRGIPRKEHTISFQSSSSANENEKCDIQSGISLILQVGSVATRMTLLGSLPSTSHSTTLSKDLSETVVAAHSKGLNGAFLFPFHHLLKTRCRLWSDPLDKPSALIKSHNDAVIDSERNITEERMVLGSTCLHAALSRSPSVSSRESKNHLCKENNLDMFYCLARRRHFSLKGLEHILSVGVEINPDSLQLDFPYQCGGEQSRKEYFDILADITGAFTPHSLQRKDTFFHGAKYLCRYGLAVCLGVRPNEMLGNTPSMYWHPYGAPAACTAPLFNSCGSICVGMTALEYNGPTASSELLRCDDHPSHYAQPSRRQGGFDQSVWLNQRLFHVSPGEEWKGWQSEVYDEPFEVLGTQYNEAMGEFELFLEGRTTHQRIAASDV